MFKETEISHTQVRYSLVTFIDVAPDRHVCLGCLQELSPWSLKEPLFQRDLLSGLSFISKSIDLTVTPEIEHHPRWMPFV